MSTLQLLLAYLPISLALVGAGFVVVAALGILRLPDVLTRMHAATKAGTLGAGLLLAAAAVAAPEAGHAVRALLTILFLLLTSPTAAHVVGRAVWCSGRHPLAPGTTVPKPAPQPEEGAS